MAEGMHRCNVTILSGADELTHWVGSPSVEGGELVGIDMSATNGPPQFDYCGTDARSQYKFNVETKILGADATAQNAFIANYAVGTVFTAPTISGLPAGLDWIVEKANVRHNAEGNNPSILAITLAEVGPTAGS